jgi:hypothetical protein
MQNCLQAKKPRMSFSEVYGGLRRTELGLQRGARDGERAAKVIVFTDVAGHRFD